MWQRRASPLHARIGLSKFRALLADPRWSIREPVAYVLIGDGVVRVGCIGLADACASGIEMRAHVGHRLGVYQRATGVKLGSSRLPLHPLRVTIKECGVKTLHVPVPAIFIRR